MTVDILAATFFWPEGLVLGSEQSPPGIIDSDAETEAPSDSQPKGTAPWAAVSNVFSRMSWRKVSTVQV